MIPVILLLVEQICPTAPQIDNLRTPISILLKPGTLKAIECIANPLPAAYNAFVLIVAEATFVADAHQCCGTNVRIAHWALAVAFVTEAAHGYAWCFAAHYEIGVVAGHIVVDGLIGRRLLDYKGFEGIEEVSKKIGIVV